MKILVFGASGSIGSQIVKQAPDQGHRVTAFSRSASQLDSNPNLDTVEGNVLDANTLITGTCRLPLRFAPARRQKCDTLRQRSVWNIMPTPTKFTVGLAVNNMKKPNRIVRVEFWMK